MGKRLRRVGAVAIAAAVTASACVAEAPASSRDAEVAKMVRFVERKRGRGFLTPPVVSFVPEQEFVARVHEMVDDTAATLQVDEAAFKALGWMPEADALVDKYRIAFGNGVMGFYDPITEELAVRGDKLTPYRREVVVHELTHALDDQHFGLDEEHGEGIIDSRQLAFLVAVEGDAAAAQRSWSQYRGPIEASASLLEQLSMPVSAELLGVPIALLSLAQAPYLQGPRFIRALDGEIDAMFSAFPVSEEQAWFPDRYLLGDQPQDVPDPIAGGAEIRRGEFGVFLLTLLIQRGISLDAAVNSATSGWSGGEYVTWDGGGSRRCLTATVRMDTEEQAAGLRAALSGWAASAPSATLSALGADTEIESCSSAGE